MATPQTTNSTEVSVNNKVSLNIDTPEPTISVDADAARQLIAQGAAQGDPFDTEAEYVTGTQRATCANDPETLACLKRAEDGNKRRDDKPK